MTEHPFCDKCGDHEVTDHICSFCESNKMVLLVEALRLHEWGIDGADVCRVCYMDEERGHIECCIVGRALL